MPTPQPSPVAKEAGPLKEMSTLTLRRPSTFWLYGSRSKEFWGKGEHISNKKCKCTLKVTKNNKEKSLSLRFVDYGKFSDKEHVTSNVLSTTLEKRNFGNWKSMCQVIAHLNYSQLLYLVSLNFYLLSQLLEANQDKKSKRSIQLLNT